MSYKKLHIPQCLIKLELKYTVNLNTPIHHDHHSVFQAPLKITSGLDYSTLISGGEN